MKLSISYPPAKDGYWSPVTSTLNWCEEDYYATPYIAEIVNTVTNIVFVALALRGVQNCIKHKHDTVFLIAFLTYMFIGVGSICFHASLKYEMQLLDELSMIYTVCVLLFATLSYGKPRIVENAVGVFATSLAIFITGYYHFLQDPTFHQNAFALISSFIVFRSIYIMEKTLRPSTTKSNDGNVIPLTRKQRRDLNILRSMWTLVISGLVTVGVGFLLWNLDNIFCNTLISWRRRIGLPWGILLEGHGWWHIATGLSMYYNLTWGVWLRYCLKGMQDDVQFIWPFFWTSMPLIVRKPLSPSVQNGKKTH